MLSYLRCTKRWYARTRNSLPSVRSTWLAFLPAGHLWSLPAREPSRLLEEISWRTHFGKGYTIRSGAGMDEDWLSASRTVVIMGYQRHRLNSWTSLIMKWTNLKRWVKHARIDNTECLGQDRGSIQIIDNFGTHNFHVDIFFLAESFCLVSALFLLWSVLIWYRTNTWLYIGIQYSLSPQSFFYRILMSPWWHFIRGTLPVSIPFTTMNLHNKLMML